VRFESIETGVYPTLVYPPYVSTVKRGPTQEPLRIRAAAPVQTNIKTSRSLIMSPDTDLTAQGQA